MSDAPEPSDPHAAPLARLLLWARRFAALDVGAEDTLSAATDFDAWEQRFMAQRLRPLLLLGFMGIVSFAIGDVLFYSAPWCANCAEAKGWMRRYGFKYQECDIDARPECAQQLRGMGGDGVPYLVVKGHHMKDGFDSSEFIAALQK